MRTTLKKAPEYLIRPLLAFAIFSLTRGPADNWDREYINTSFDIDGDNKSADALVVVGTANNELAVVLAALIVTPEVLEDVVDSAVLTFDEASGRTTICIF